MRILLLVLVGSLLAFTFMDSGAYGTEFTKQHQVIPTPEYPHGADQSVFFQFTEDEYAVCFIGKGLRCVLFGGEELVPCIPVSKEFIQCNSGDYQVLK